MRLNSVAHDQRGTSDEIYMVCVRHTLQGFVVVGKWGRRGRALKSQVKAVFQSKGNAISKAEMLFVEKLKKGYVDIESSHYDGPLTMTDTPVVENLEEMDDVTTGTMSLSEGQRGMVTSIGESEKFFSGPALIKLKNGETHSIMKCDCGGTTFGHTVDEDNNTMLRCDGCRKLWGLNGKSLTSSDYDEDAVTCTDNTGMEDKFDEGVEYISEKHSDGLMIYVYDKLGDRQECFRDRFHRPSPFVKMEPGTNKITVFGAKKEMKHFA